MAPSERPWPREPPRGQKAATDMEKYLYNIPQDEDACSSDGEERLDRGLIMRLERQTERLAQAFTLEVEKRPSHWTFSAWKTLPGNHIPTRVDIDIGYLHPTDPPLATRVDGEARQLIQRRSSFGDLHSLFAELFAIESPAGLGSAEIEKPSTHLSIASPGLPPQVSHSDLLLRLRFDVRKGGNREKSRTQEKSSEKGKRKVEYEEEADSSDSDRPRIKKVKGNAKAGPRTAPKPEPKPKRKKGEGERVDTSDDKRSVESLDSD